MLKIQLFFNICNYSINDLDYSSSSVANIINVGVQSIPGLAFGGQSLFLVDGISSVNVLDGTVTQTNFGGSSLYALNGLCVTGRGSTYLEIP